VVPLFAIEARDLTREFVRPARGQSTWQRLLRPRYEAVRAVSDVTLKVGEGEIVGYILTWGPCCTFTPASSAWASACAATGPPSCSTPIRDRLGGGVRITFQFAPETTIPPEIPHQLEADLPGAAVRPEPVNLAVDDAPIEEVVNYMGGLSGTALWSALGVQMFWAVVLVFAADR